MKPLLYKDEMASAPTQKHLSEVLSGGGEEDFQSCKMSFFTQIISVQPNLPQGKVRVLLKIIGLGIGYPSDTAYNGQIKIFKPFSRHENFKRDFSKILGHYYT